MVKEFTLALQRDLNEKDGLDQAEELHPFTVAGDDQQLYIEFPDETHLALIASSMSEWAETGQQAVAVMELFWMLLPRESALHLRRRLRDRKDAFGLADIVNILEWVVEEAAARPTKPSSDSTGTQQRTGERSTATSQRKVSTRSRSRQIDSAT